MKSGVAILKRMVEKDSLRREHMSKNLDEAKRKERVMQISKKQHSRQRIQQVQSC